MTVPQVQFEELRLQDFRCFRDKQSAHLAPLTLLVGENSTGKTSFLAALRALADIDYLNYEPDFRAPPYDLGVFSEIVHSPGGRGTPPCSFGLGVTAIWKRAPVKLDLTFESHAAAPYPSSIALEGEGAWIKSPGGDGKLTTIDFGIADRAWRWREPPGLSRLEPNSPPLIAWIMRRFRDVGEFGENSSPLGARNDMPGQQALKDIERLSVPFAFLPQVIRMFAGAPIRSSPRRIYDTNTLSPDPEGAYVPAYLSNLDFRDRAGWQHLKEKLEQFGADSGLFDEFDVKQLGTREGEPFQLEVRKYGKTTKGRKRNLVDVGYGVSQVLPMIAELYRPRGSSMFLFQQPEIHLHPSAQAALGSLFCDAATAGHQLIVETHSDYIVDRILLDIRDKRTTLTPEDVSILYFERNDHSVSIHSIGIDKQGEVLNTPESYRRFFKAELKRVIEY